MTPHTAVYYPRIESTRNFCTKQLSGRSWSKGAPTGNRYARIQSARKSGESRLCSMQREKRISAIRKELPEVFRGGGAQRIAQKRSKLHSMGVPKIHRHIPFTDPQPEIVRVESHVKSGRCGISRGTCWPYTRKTGQPATPPTQYSMLNTKREGARRS